MAHRILVWLDVDDEYVDTHPQITAEDYLDGSKARGWEVVEGRVFTESEVKALLRQIVDEMLLDSEVSDLSEIASAHGITLDPA